MGLSMYYPYFPATPKGICITQARLINSLLERLILVRVEEKDSLASLIASTGIFM